MGKRKISENSLKLYVGNLVVFVANDNPFIDDDITPGSLGIFMEYPPEAKKFLPGLEPVRVLFGCNIYSLYRDNIEIVK